MTPETLRKHMRELGLSQLTLAERLGITSGALNRMACGHTPVAPYVEAMLQMIRENNALRIASKYQIERKVKPPKRRTRKPATKPTPPDSPPL